MQILHERGAYMGVGANIKALRKKAGMQQKELAALIGQTATSIMHYEKEDRKPSQEVIEKIATALNVSPTTLMDWDDWDERFNQEGKMSEELKTIEAIQSMFGDDAVELLQQFQQLNESGKQKLLSNIEDLTLIPKYQKESE